MNFDDGWKVRDLRALRRDRIGCVFEARCLIAFLDATDNVALLPMRVGVGNAEARASAVAQLKEYLFTEKSTAHG